MRACIIVIFGLLACLASPVGWARPSAAPAGPLELELASFNIRYGTASDGDNAWEHRRELVAEVIRTIDADVLGLQEALRFQLDEIAGACPGYTEIGVGRDDGLTRGEYSPLLVRTERFSIAASGTFWLSDTPEAVASASWGNSIPRVCTWVRLVDKRTGRAMTVFNTHWDHRSQASRERSAELLAARVAAARAARPDEPVVVMGDLNAGEDNAALRYLRGETERASHAGAWPGHTPAPPPRLVDTFRAVHPDAAEAGTFTGFTFGATGGEKIDYVLVSDGAEVLDASIDRTERGGRYPSDHFPVTARVRFP